MIVLDASAAVDYLLGIGAAERIADRLRAEGASIHAPYVLDLEVAQALRRLVFRGVLPTSRAQEALEDYGNLRVRRYPHLRLLARIWELRSNLTVFDAAYVALAEALNAPLITADAALARAPTHAARVEVYR